MGSGGAEDVAGGDDEGSGATGTGGEKCRGRVAIVEKSAHGAEDARKQSETQGKAERRFVEKEGQGEYGGRDGEEKAAEGERDGFERGAAGPDREPGEKAAEQPAAGSAEKDKARGDGGAVANEIGDGNPERFGNAEIAMDGGLEVVRVEPGQRIFAGTFLMQRLQRGRADVQKVFGDGLETRAVADQRGGEEAARKDDADQRDQAGGEPF